MAAAKKRPTPPDEAAGGATVRPGRDPIELPRLVPAGKTALDTVGWRTHDATIKSADGKVIFEQKGIRAPKTWSE
ncbi:MAG TPA: hypothetical protein VEE86_01070, partial [Thermoplasmata archaeon]|nr:hypothetical protein [Thermoplasmata archaeon]